MRKAISIGEQIYSIDDTKIFGIIETQEREKKMSNSKFRFNDDRPVVWTFSENGSDLYCIYIRSVLVHENLSFDEFYPLFKRTLAEQS